MTYISRWRERGAAGAENGWTRKAGARSASRGAPFEMGLGPRERNASEEVSDERHRRGT
jgi:hypothetical protein